MAPLRLIPPVVDQATVAALQKLLAEAQKGRLVGLAYIAMYCGSKYSGDLVGRAEADPMLARGIADALHDLVATQNPPLKR